MLKLVFACVFLSSVFLTGQTPLVPSQVGTASLTNEDVPSNVLSYGAAVSGSFDDNVTNPGNPSVGESNFSWSIQPHVRLAVNRTRWSTELYYGPSFTYSTNISAYDSTSHSAGADFDYHFTRRLSVTSRSSFSLTSTPFESFQANAQLPDLGVLNRANSNSVGANLRNRLGQSQADLVYLLGRHTSLGIGGAFSSSRNESLNAGSITDTTQDFRGWSGHAFYSHQLTKPYSLGVQYAVRDLYSEATIGQFSSLSHQFLGFLNIALKSSVQLSIFAGPEFSRVDNTLTLFAAQFPMQFHSTTFAGGSNLAWRGEHSGLSLSFVQQVGDSGVNGAGSVIVRTARVEAQRGLSRRSSLSLNGGYIGNHQFGPITQPSLADYVSAGVSFSRTLSSRLTLLVSGTRQQLIGRPTLGFQQRSHDVASVSLSYTLQQPIGR